MRQHGGWAPDHPRRPPEWEEGLQSTPNGRVPWLSTSNAVGCRGKCNGRNQGCGHYQPTARLRHAEVEEINYVVVGLVAEIREEIEEPANGSVGWIDVLNTGNILQENVLGTKAANESVEFVEQGRS